LANVAVTEGEVIRSASALLPAERKEPLERVIVPAGTERAKPLLRFTSLESVRSLPPEMLRMVVPAGMLPPVISIPGARFCVPETNTCEPPNVSAVPALNVMELPKMSVPEPKMEEMTPTVPPPTIVMPAAKFAVLLTTSVVPPEANEPVAVKPGFATVSVKAPLLNPVMMGSLPE